MVHVFDLLEAEGRGLMTVVRAEARHARASAVNLAMGLAVLVIGIPLVIAGACLSAAGLLWWLESEVSRPLAAAITGVLLLAAGLICISLFKALAFRKQP